MFPQPLPGVSSENRHWSKYWGPNKQKQRTKKDTEFVPDIEARVMKRILSLPARTNIFVE